MGDWGKSGTGGSDKVVRGEKKRKCKSCKHNDAVIGDLCMGCRLQRGGR